MAKDRQRIGFRTFSLPAELEAKIKSIAIERWQLDLDDGKSLRPLADAILKMSNYYKDSPAERTPWNEKWCQQAQLCYYLPLNYLRNRAVVSEGQKFGFFDGIQTATDFGAGLGAAQIALHESCSHISMESIEISTIANEIRRDFMAGTSKSSARQKGDLLICSYSMTEDSPLEMKGYQNLMLVEPSLIEDARSLQQLRQTLIDQAYSIWAPCTHQLRCPLLVHSDRDWCHDRIHFDRPSWFLRLEQILPIKNENLTFSYLLASKRSPPPVSGKARMIGDYLAEKGKARQLFCRSESREYLAMLSRDGQLPEYSRGALIDVPTGGTSTASEYRIKS